MSIIQRSGNYGSFFGSTFESSGTLTDEQKKANALYIYRFLKNESWSTNAIAAIIGNMEAESGLNPGRWQSDNVGNTAAGYGLVQWTPATKYIDWCEAKGYEDASHMDSGLNRILFEVWNDLQWIQTEAYNYSFSDFTKSTENAGALAIAFLLNYERPADQGAAVQEYRSELASNWYTYLIGSGGNQSLRRKRKKYKFVLFNRRRILN